MLLLSIALSFKGKEKEGSFSATHPPPCVIAYFHDASSLQS